MLELSKMTEEELYKYIKSENTDIKLLRAIAKAVTYYCDDFFDLLSTINLPQIDILLKDKDLSSKFLKCLEDELLSNYVDTSMYIRPLEKIFEHPNTTQEMLRNAYQCGFRAYVMDKLDMNETINRKILKDIRNKDFSPDIREQASKILKEDSSLKPTAVAVLINLNSLMQDFMCYSNRNSETLCDYCITGSLLQKLSLLLEEMSKFKEQMDVEKLIFIPMLSEIYESYRPELNKYEIKYTGRWIPGDDKDTVRRKVKLSKKTNGMISIPIYHGGREFYREKLPRDYVLFDENLEFCKWLYSCIAKIITDGYVNKEGNTIMTDNIIFDTGFYSDGYIKVERSQKYGNFNITRRYIKDGFMKSGITNYIDELTTDYKILQVVDADIAKSSTELSFIDCLYGEDIPVSVMYPGGYYQIPATDFYNLNGKNYFNAKNALNYTEITNDGILFDVSDDDNHFVKILVDGTFSVGVAEKGYNGLIQCFQRINEVQKKISRINKTRRP